MDSTSILIAVVLLCVSGGCWANEPELLIEPAGPIKLGDTVVIKCTVPANSPLDMYKIVRIVEGQDFTLTTKGSVDDYFHGTGRYAVTHFDARLGEVHLTITDVTGADGGHIQCLHVNSGQSASEIISINVPPKRVELLYFDGDTKVVVEEGQTVTMATNQEGGFACQIEIEGSQYEPMVEIMMDDVDIKYEMHEEPQLTKINREGLLEVARTITYTYRRESPDKSFNGKTLTCSAKMPEYEKMQASAVIEVEYGPTLVCGSAYFKLGAQDAKLVCEGTMHPAPTYSTWWWGKKPDRIVLNTGDTIEGFKADIQELGNDRYEMTLTIAEVTSDLFRKFKLEVDNAISSAEQTVHLKEEIVTYAPVTQPKPTTVPTEADHRAAPDTGAASSRSASVWTLVMSAATIIAATMLSLSTS